MGDLAGLIFSIGGALAAVISAVAGLVVAIRGSRGDAERAARAVLQAAVSPADKEQDDRLSKIEDHLRDGEQ